MRPRRISRRRIIRVACTLTILGSGVLVPLSPANAADQVTTNGCAESVPEPGTTTPVRICYSLFKPAGASATKTVPLIFHSHGWGGSRTKDPAAFKSWLDAGYGVLSFDQRRFGESTGVAHGMTPDLEGRDVIRLIDLVASLDWVTIRPGLARQSRPHARHPGADRPRPVRQPVQPEPRPAELRL